MRDVEIASLELPIKGSFKIGPFGSSLKVHELVRKGITVLGIENIHANLFVKGFRRFITKDKFQQLSKYKVQSDDILVSTMGTIGRAALVPNGIGTAIFDGHLFRMRVDTSKVFPRYLCFAINGYDNLLQQLTRQSRGAIMDGLNTTILKECKIPLPSIPEQKRIAAILNNANHLHHQCRFAQTLSDSFLQSVFIKMFGEYLEADEHPTLENVLSIQLSNGVFESNHKYGSGIPVIWVDDLYHTNTVDTSNLRRLNVDEKTARKYEVIPGDLLFTRSSLVREGIGRINIVPEVREQTLFECHVIRGRVDCKTVNPFYLLGLYRSEWGRSVIIKRANTATMTTISQQALNTLPCPIPPLDLQEQFAAIVQKFERIRRQQREASRQAEHLFKTLLHRAFGGKL